MNHVDTEVSIVNVQWGEKSKVIFPKAETTLKLHI